MAKEKVRRIIWHCDAGHDFEVEDEFRRERCPICGGTGIGRVGEDGKEGSARQGRRSIRSWLGR